MVDAKIRQADAARLASQFLDATYRRSITTDEDTMDRIALEVHDYDNGNGMFLEFNAELEKQLGPDVSGRLRDKWNEPDNLALAIIKNDTDSFLGVDRKRASDYLRFGKYRGAGNALAMTNGVWRAGDKMVDLVAERPVIGTATLVIGYAAFCVFPGTAIFAGAALGLYAVYNGYEAYQIKSNAKKLSEDPQSGATETGVESLAYEDMGEAAANFLLSLLLMKGGFGIRKEVAAVAKAGTKAAATVAAEVPAAVGAAAETASSAVVTAAQKLTLGTRACRGTKAAAGAVWNFAKQKAVGFGRRVKSAWHTGIDLVKPRPAVFNRALSLAWRTARTATKEHGKNSMITIEQMVGDAWVPEVFISAPWRAAWTAYRAAISGRRYKVVVDVAPRSPMDVTYMVKSSPKVAAKKARNSSLFHPLRGVGTVFRDFVAEWKVQNPKAVPATAAAKVPGRFALVASDSLVRFGIAAGTTKQEEMFKSFMSPGRQEEPTVDMSMPTQIQDGQADVELPGQPEAFFDKDDVQFFEVLMRKVANAQQAKDGKEGQQAISEGEMLSILQKMSPEFAKLDQQVKEHRIDEKQAMIITQRLFMKTMQMAAMAQRLKDGQTGGEIPVQELGQIFQQTILEDMARNRQPQDVQADSAGESGAADVSGGSSDDTGE